MRASRLFVVAIACFIFGGVVLAGGQGRTQVVRLPPLDGLETVADCGSYKVLESFILQTKVMVHYDKDGTLLKEVDHLSTAGKTTYFNSESPQISFTGGPEHPTININYDHMTYVVSGVNYKFTIPGGGMIFHQGGHYIFNMITGEWTQVGGPDDWWTGDIDALCAALAP